MSIVCESLEVKKFSFLMVLLLFSVAYFFYDVLYLPLLALVMVMGGGIAVVGLLDPTRLCFMYVAWMKLGHLLGVIVSPLVMAVIFYMLITPFSIFGKLIFRDALHLKKKNAESYWTPRQEYGVGSDSFKRQF